MFSGHFCVGYNTKTTDGQRSPLIGLSFTPVTGATAKLGDFKPADGTMSPDDDMLQVINPTTFASDMLYSYCDKTTADAIAEEEKEPAGTFDAWIGWWDVIKGGIGSEEEGAFCNDTPVTPGFGFMGAFNSGNHVQFQSSGEAPTVATSFTTDGTRSPIIVNYIPKTITLGQFAPADGTMSPDDDMLQVINATTFASDKLYSYCDKTTADAIAEEEKEPAGTFDAWIGWWDAIKGGIGSEEEGSFCNDTPVTAGEGFMGAFNSGNKVTFQLPSSIAE